jgi:hypothetical protein
MIYFGVFTGMEDYSKMTRLWGVRSIHDNPVLDDGFTNRGRRPSISNQMY